MKKPRKVLSSSPIKFKANQWYHDMKIFEEFDVLRKFWSHNDQAYVYIGDKTFKWTETVLKILPLHMRLKWVKR